MTPAIRTQADAVTKAADEVAVFIIAVAPSLPGVLVRLNVRMLIASLERNGITDLFAASDLAKQYFAAGSSMVVEPRSNRWRQILIACDMTEEAKIRQLQKLLDNARTDRRIDTE